MTEIILILLAILFGSLRGIREGLVMIQRTDFMSDGFDSLNECGIRSHKWFKYYHALSVLVFGMFTVLLYMIIKNPPTIYFALGLLVIIWQCTEAGYNSCKM